MSTLISSQDLQKEFEAKFASVKAKFQLGDTRALQTSQKRVIEHLVLTQEKTDLDQLPNSDVRVTYLYLAQQLQKAASPEHSKTITELVLTHKIPAKRENGRQDAEGDAPLPLSSSRSALISDMDPDECVGYLALGLEGNTELSKLDLSGNNISAFGAYCLAQSLKRKLLTSLSLDRNFIGNEGVFFIAEAIAQSKNLALSLRKNSITHIKPLIEILDCLQSLDLSCNFLCDDAVAELAAALESNTTLKKLKLDSVNMGAGGVAALVAMLEKNHTITELELVNPSDEFRNISVSWKNSFTQADLEKINQLLERNQREADATAAAAEAAAASVRANLQPSPSTTSQRESIKLIANVFGVVGILLLVAAGLFLGLDLIPLVLLGAAVVSLSISCAIHFTLACQKFCYTSTPAASAHRSTYSELAPHLGESQAAGDSIELSPIDSVRNTPSPLAAPKLVRPNEENSQITYHPSASLASPVSAR